MPSLPWWNRWAIRKSEYNRICLIVRMRNDQDLCIHPSVTAIASHVGQTTGRHATGNDLVGERERQIVRGCAIHVHSVQGGIRALHPQLGILRHQENVRLVPAALLVEQASGFGEVYRFPPRNIFQEYHGICDTTLWPDNQPLQIANLV